MGTSAGQAAFAAVWAAFAFGCIGSHTPSSGEGSSSSETGTGSTSPTSQAGAGTNTTGAPVAGSSAAASSMTGVTTGASSSVEAGSTPASDANNAASTGSTAAKGTTSLVVTINGTAMAPATYACYDWSAGINVYTFDVDTWRMTHGTHTVPKTAKGPIVHINGTKSVPSIAANTAAYLGISATTVASCVLTSYAGTSGSITITSSTGSADSSVISGTVDVALAGPSGEQSGSIKGTFTAPVCKTVANIESNGYDGSSDPLACSGLGTEVTANGAFLNEK